MPEAGEVTPEERLARMESIIIDCESAASEIERQFGHIEENLRDTEDRAEALTSEIGLMTSDTIAHAESNLNEVMSAMSELANDVQQLLGSVQRLLGMADEKSESLFSKMSLMDSEQTAIREQINENSVHMHSIFQAINAAWEGVASRLTEMREENHDHIVSSVQELSTTLYEDEASNIAELIAQKRQEQVETVTAEVTEHLSKISGHYEDAFVPNVMSVLDENINLQEEASNQFSDMRLSTVNAMFDGTQELSAQVTGIMDAMKGTVSTTSDVADVVVDAMDQTNIGLNQIVEAIDNLLTLFGGLSLD